MTPSKDKTLTLKRRLTGFERCGNAFGVFYQKWTRLLNERTVSSSNTIWSLATIRTATIYLYIYISDFEVRVVKLARHEGQFSGPLG